MDEYPEWTVDQWEKAWTIHVGKAYCCCKCGNMVMVTKGGVSRWVSVRTRKPVAVQLTNITIIKRFGFVMAKNILGQTYFCSICGSEISVIRNGKGKLSPVCCERPMVLREKINRVYFCSVCGSQIMLVRSGSDNLTPTCCHVPMQEIITAKAA
jgi:desulfoferrodoxin-like iron-binding protein